MKMNKLYSTPDTKNYGQLNMWRTKYILNLKMNTSEMYGYKTIAFAFCFAKFGA